MTSTALKPFAGMVIAVTSAGSSIGRTTAIYRGYGGASLATSDVKNMSAENIAAQIKMDCPKVITSAIDNRHQRGKRDIKVSDVINSIREELRVLSEGGIIVNASSVLGLRSALEAGESPVFSSQAWNTWANENSHKRIWAQKHPH
ncbi:ABA4 protein [Paramyrothecium foliicola]|nr:ABA4 protein [Paramyrothecium foliicola]